MQEHFTCSHCRKKHDIRMKRSGTVMVARMMEKNLSDKIEEFFSGIEITSYLVDKNAVTLPVCEGCIKEFTKQYDLLFYGSLIGGLLLLSIQFYTGILWYVSAPGLLLVLVALQYRSENGRHWKDVADRIVVKVVSKIMAREMERNPAMKILTREEHSKMISRE